MDTEPRSDLAVAAAAAATVSDPRVDPPDSFVLHAPLELVARFALLPYVRPANRDAARARIADIATKLDAFGRAVDPPATAAFGSDVEAAEGLTAALDRAEVDDADAAAAWLGRHTDPAQLPALLGDAVVARLAAAGHAPIFLAHWPRVCPRRELPGTLLRPLARSLAVGAEPRITWVDRPSVADRPSGGPADVFGALAAAPRLGPPTVDFVAPIMRRVDVEQTVAALAPVVAVATAGGAEARRDAGRDVLRAAAWTMLREPGDHAPYLWSHCLTMPQAVLAIAEHATAPERHLAVALTHVAGFRSAFATGDLVLSFDDAPPALAFTEAIDAGQQVAAAAAWHAPHDARDAMVDELVNRAAVHEDAHLVKYTLACLDAAAADPAADRLFVAAAASLHGWWARSAPAA